jgi:carbamate kinase
MRVVVALGGNTLLRRGQPLAADVHRANVEVAARAVAAITAEHHVVLTAGPYACHPAAGDLRPWRGRHPVATLVAWKRSA